MVTNRRRPRRGVRIAIVALLGLVLLGGVAAFARSGNGGDSSAPSGGAGNGDVGSFEQGDVVPASATMEMFDGETATFGDFRGQPLVLNFYASWCQPCLAELPDFETVHQEVRDDVAFLGAAMQDDSPESSLRIIEQTGVTYPLAWDGDGRLFQAFGGFAMPTTVFIDADGQVVQRQNGIMAIGELRAAVENIKG